MRANGESLSLRSLRFVFVHLACGMNMDDCIRPRTIPRLCGFIPRPIPLSRWTFRTSLDALACGWLNSVDICHVGAF